jgi:glycosyltransferase involved in cell wall biosynthesis
MKGPLVSIIIDNYNYAGFIREAIDSALDQTYHNIEVIVVDDGSTDQSREAISSYGDRVITVFKDNGGQASAFNEGFRIAKGELVAFLDADDYFFHNKIERVVEAYKGSPGCVMYYHPVQKVNQEGQPLSKPEPTGGYTGLFDRLFRKSGGWYPFPPTSGLVFNYRLIQPIFGLPEEELRVCADSYLHDTACFLGKLFYLDECLAAYRLHGNNLWSNSVYLQGKAYQQRIDRLLVRNAMLNLFLAKTDQLTVNADNSFILKELQWLSNDLPFSSLFKLMSHAIRYPLFPVLKRIKIFIKLPVMYLKNRLTKAKQLQ